MKRIFKYILQPCSLQKLGLPVMARPLCVQEQDGAIVLYCEADDSVEYEPVPVRIVVTGEQVPEHGLYVGTVMMLHGSLVYHVYIGGMS